MPKARPKPKVNVKFAFTADAQAMQRLRRCFGLLLSDNVRVSADHAGTLKARNKDILDQGDWREQ